MQEDSCEGSDAMNRLLCRLRDRRFVIEPRVVGIVPFKEFMWRVMAVRVEIVPYTVGIVPMSLLPLISRVDSHRNIVNSVC